jgi:hypothetical protein
MIVRGERELRGERYGKGERSLATTAVSSFIAVISVPPVHELAAGQPFSARRQRLNA